MPAESTFDIVSDYDQQELRNAVDQAQREVQQRYDLKDSKTTFELKDTELVISTDSEMHLDAVRDLLQTKALRRQLSLKIFNYGTVEQVTGGRVRQIVTLQKGIADDLAKKLQKMIKEQFPKIQARIQGDALRVGSKNKDDLQAVIKVLRAREDEFTVPLQFTNYR